jgi:hypothetical protein
MKRHVPTKKRRPVQPLDTRDLQRVAGGVGGDTTKTPFNCAEDDWEAPVA